MGLHVTSTAVQHMQVTGKLPRFSMTANLAAAKHDNTSSPEKTGENQEPGDGKNQTNFIHLQLMAQRRGARIAHLVHETLVVYLCLRARLGIE